jgi:DNA-binding protein Fis
MSTSQSKKHIEECVRDSLETYFKDLRGVEPAAMYEMILRVVEKPLIGWASTATHCGASWWSTSW